MASASGMNLDKLMKDAQSRDFHPVNLGSEARRHTWSARSGTSNRTTWSRSCPAQTTNSRTKRCSTPRTTIISAFAPTCRGTTFSTAPTTTPPDAAFCWNWRELLARRRSRPRRSILFAAVTAEEQGLLGSEYLGKHPPIPAGKISLDLNYDDVKPLGAPEEVEVSGAERTNFYPSVEATAKEFRLAIRPDARPEAGHFYRSDHFSLARVGIPSFSINEGMKYKGHPESWGVEQGARIRREALSPAQR